MNKNDAFINTVKASTLLTQAQKQEFLDTPEILPEEYREKIVEILNTFDMRVKARGERVKKRLQHSIDSKI